MTTPDMKKAREWAESVGDIEGLRPEPRAAVEVIQSLPDQWIDAEKLREVIEAYEPIVSGAFIDNIRDLLPPTLPTLAELIEQGNDPQQYQWMQCTVEGMGDDTFVIASVRELVTKVLLPDGMHEVKGNSQVTPLQGEPKMEWPGDGVVDAEIVEDDEPVMMPRPEDVPEGEPWLVKCNGHDWVGTRELEEETSWPWAMARLDGVDYGMAGDSDVTLVSRLVPEVGA